MDKITAFITLGYIDPGTGFTITTFSGWLLAFLLGFMGMLLLSLKKAFGALLKKKYFKRIAIILLVSLLMVLIIKGAFMQEVKSHSGKKTVILGIDALSPEIMEPMMREGRLPNFSRLKEKGSYRRLATTNPAESPVAWAGFATGKNPGKSGVSDFVVRDPKTYKINLFSFAEISGGKAERMFKTDCFWQYLMKKKVPTVIICCPDTFPPDKVYGKMLSGLGVPDIIGTKGIFTYYVTGGAKNAYYGGRISYIGKGPVMVIELFGPRVAGISGRVENAKVPAKVTINNAESVTIQYQEHTLELGPGRWSDWCEVSFDAGLLKKVKGIFKFYLNEVEPEFRLYMTPINFDPRDPLLPISYPQDYSKELAGRVGLYYTQGMPEDTLGANEGVLSEEVFLEQVDEIFRQRKAMLDLELRDLKNGVLFCYFSSLDVVQHMFWRDLKGGEAGAPGKHKETIYEWYERMDGVLGEVLDQLGKDDVVIVLSDHGFGSFKRAVHLNGWLREHGYLVLKNPKTTFAGEPLANIDWTKTKAYAIGFVGICLNQKGRERDGIVEAGQEAESLKKEIADKLLKWADEKSGGLVLRRVFNREDIMHGPYAKDAPDLFVGFNDGYRASWETAVGIVPPGLLEDNLKKWAGDHIIDPDLVPGVFFSNIKIRKEKPSIYDIAPTILKIEGYDEREIKECDFDGEALQ